MRELKNWLLLGAGLLALAPWIELPTQDLGPDEPGAPGTPGDPVEVCATGCAAVPAPDLDLGRSEFERLVRDFGREPLTGGPALETLLFHGASARGWIDYLGSAALEPLGAERAALLTAELDRDQALLSVRVTDADGNERFTLDRVRVPLAEKQHLHPDAALDLQLPEVSGTVQRVGLNHLWTRL